MPELPEVETIRRGLDEYIVKQKIVSVDVYCEKSFCGVVGDIVGRKIEKIRRYGKALIVDLDGGVSLMIHLRMTGQLIYDGETRYAAGHPSENFVAKLPNKQTRVVIKLSDGVLYFNDQRKFGFIKVLPTARVEQDEFVKKLAKEPWDMSIDDFYEKLQRHQKACIKAVLLDQTIICGLGNIYADEALYVAKIHPERRAGELDKPEAEKLLKAACEVMDESIESGGSTMATYVRADGTKGDYLEKFAKVFRKEGLACPRCGAKIIKKRVAGRGTHICPKCQKDTVDTTPAVEEGVRND
ncbi:MAG: bifunctional DNA-formamidopyrimidine glycosylase/DNA-(apurinic or apyrimidinic site) lyase [Candidatus Saccharimonadaceae bacterium]|nr:bifunctional DNA-formamidopyrimidine glycosylase/DNA-(apurinic or apyrimidinic site) lyase [Candidatus Saccharimonadaceae bacterium]